MESSWYLHIYMCPILFLSVTLPRYPPLGCSAFQLLPLSPVRFSAFLSLVFILFPTSLKNASLFLMIFFQVSTHYVCATMVLHMREKHGICFSGFWFILLNTRICICKYFPSKFIGLFSLCWINCTMHVYHSILSIHLWEDTLAGSVRFGSASIAVGAKLESFGMYPRVVCLGHVILFLVY